jgi:hypothetical protein
VTIPNDHTLGLDLNLLKNHKIVRDNLLKFFYLLLKTIIKMLNPSILQSINAMFEPHQLSNLEFYKILTDTIEWSLLVMDIFQVVYEGAESKVSNLFHRFLLGSV